MVSLGSMGLLWFLAYSFSYNENKSMLNILFWIAIIVIPGALLLVISLFLVPFFFAGIEGGLMAGGMLGIIAIIFAVSSLIDYVVFAWGKSVGKKRREEGKKFLPF